MPTNLTPARPLRVGLVGCSKAKAATARTACQLYTSALFRKAADYCQRHYDCWFILSARYGLVEPDRILEPYDFPLAGQTRAVRDAWADRVAADLDRRGLCHAMFFVHAGQAYARALTDKLDCQRPLAGLGVGQQLAWYGRHDMPHLLCVPALEMRQGGRTLYLFAVDGKRLQDFAAVSRVGRDDDGTLFGYQRPEVLAHVAQIRAYLETEQALLPNALVLAFDRPVPFKPTGPGSRFCRPGQLTLTLGQDEQARPAWIVDGQQRAAALRELTREGFPVCVVAFVARDLAEQREQFLLVNNSKPLPKGLVYELLPQTEVLLPQRLAKQRFPVRLLDRLNRDADSPLQGRIRTATRPDGLIQDTSVLAMLHNSLTDGILYRFRASGSGDADLEGMLQLLKDFWSAVAQVFPEAWARPPRLSRLTHGAGIRALGLLMDEIADHFQEDGLPTRSRFVKELQRIGPLCHWTPESGDWQLEGFQRRWNEVQNTPRDTRLLANLLCREYRRLVRRQGGPVQAG